MQSQFAIDTYKTIYWLYNYMSFVSQYQVFQMDWSFSKQFCGFLCQASPIISMMEKSREKMPGTKTKTLHLQSPCMYFYLKNRIQTSNFARQMFQDWKNRFGGSTLSQFQAELRICESRIEKKIYEYMKYRLKKLTWHSNS